MSLTPVKCHRKAPIIDAVQVTNDNLDAIVEWSEGRIGNPLKDSERKYWKIGDWFVKTDDGEGHMSNADFRKQYDIV